MQPIDLATRQAKYFGQHNIGICAEPWRLPRLSAEAAAPRQSGQKTIAISFPEAALPQMIRSRKARCIGQR